MVHQCFFDSHVFLSHFDVAAPQLIKAAESQSLEVDINDKWNALCTASKCFE